MAQVKAGSSAAVQAALARMRRNSGTAALAVVLAPLAAGVMALPAQAVVASGSLDGGNAQIFGSTTALAGGLTRFTYTVSENRGFGNQYTLDKFEIPEVAAGDFNLSSFSGPEGWTATLENSSTQSGTGFKSGQGTAIPGAYILVATTPGNGVSEGTGGQAFSFVTSETGSLNANFGGTVDTNVHYDNTEGYTVYATGYVDPPVPGGPAPVVTPTPTPPGTTVPEPASMLILGGAVLAAGATRMRRKG